MRAMDQNYKEIIRSMRTSKKMGQNFLINREVAKTEANFAIDRNVLEVGPGLGILTKELCKKAKMVTSVEKDNRLCEFLEQNIKEKNFELIKSDFFKLPKKQRNYDIMIANIPYNLSSKMLMWLGEEQIPAVLCLQKEFVEHMISKPNSRNYSRLSVMMSLMFNITYVMDVPPNDFYPEPSVHSSIIYAKPKEKKIPTKIIGIISLIMMHKKKKLRNAIVDSSKQLKLTKEKISELEKSVPYKDKRPLHMQPEQILEAAQFIGKKL